MGLCAQTMFSKKWYTTSFSNKAKRVIVHGHAQSISKNTKKWCLFLYIVLSCAVQIGKAIASHEPFWGNIIACQLMCYLFLLHAIISPQKQVLEKRICILRSEMQSHTSKLSLKRLQRFLLKEHWSRNKMYCNQYQSTLKNSLSCQSYWPEFIPECTLSSWKRHG
jgi:hypothetical protein